MPDGALGKRVVVPPLRRPAANRSEGNRLRPGGRVRADAATEVIEMPEPIEHPLPRRRWRHEAAGLLRFGIVGIAATATHYPIALSTVAAAGLPAQTRTSRASPAP